MAGKQVQGNTLSGGMRKWQEIFAARVFPLFIGPVQRPSGQKGRRAHKLSRSLGGSALVGYVDYGHASSVSHWVASGQRRLEGLLILVQHDFFLRVSFAGLVTVSHQGCLQKVCLGRWPSRSLSSKCLEVSHLAAGANTSRLGCSLVAEHTANKKESEINSKLESINK